MRKKTKNLITMKKDGTPATPTSSLLEYEQQLRHREHLLNEREAMLATRERALLDQNNAADDNTYASPINRLVKTLVFGALDGVTTTFAIVCSAIAVGQEHIAVTNIFVLGVANLVADGFSMGMGDFLSTIAEAGDASGLSPEQAHRHQLEAGKMGVIMFLSFVLFGGIPLFAFIPFITRGVGQPHEDKVHDTFQKACLLCAMSLFFLGLLKGKLNGSKNPLKTGVVMVFSGGIASVLSFTVSATVHSALK